MLLRVMLGDSFRRGSRIWNSKNTTNFIQMDSQVIRNGFYEIYARYTGVMAVKTVIIIQLLS